MPSLLEEVSEPKQENKTATTNTPPGIVLDKDGKPCRTCTSSAAWTSMMKQSTTFKKQAGATSTPAPASAPAPARECPPDVEELGRSTWTLLHSMTASYPSQPSPAHVSKTRQFLQLFAQFYPCWVCADDFQTWMAKPENEPRLASPEEFGRWMCAAHNEVNRKLGKKEFNCDLWRERWRDGWKDGRCD